MHVYAIPFTRRALIGVGLALMFALSLATGAQAQKTWTYVADLKATDVTADAVRHGRVSLQLHEADETLRYEVRVTGIERVVASHFHSVHWLTQADGTRAPLDPAKGDGPILSFFIKFESDGIPGEGVIANGTIKKTELIGDFKRRPFGDLLENLRDGYLYATVHEIERKPTGVYCCPAALRGFFRLAPGG